MYGAAYNRVMFSNSFIHEQMAAARHRDQLEAAQHARLIAQARRHHRAGPRSFWPWRTSHPRMTGEARGRAGADIRTTTSPSAAR